MTRPALLTRLNGRATRWLTAPEPNAAGRMGLFRIVYALFYLWYLATTPVETMSGYRLLDNNRILLVEYLPDLTPVALRVMESGLVAALVLLALGYHTHLATAAVLALGVVLDAVYTAVDVEHATVLLTAFIPLFMLVAGHWGDTYSLDALRKRDHGNAGVSPHDPSGDRFIGARAVLVVLALLFASACISKIVPTSTWFTHRNFMANLVLTLNVEGVVNGLPPNPTAAWIAQTPVVHEGMRVAVPVLELSFLLALLSRALRHLMVATMLVFHAMNALVLGVTFTPVLIAYLTFLDWQSLLDRFSPRRSPRPTPKHATAFASAALIAAAATGWLWYDHDALQEAVTLGGVLDWRTIWYPVLLLALGWLLVQVVAVGRRITFLDLSPAKFGGRRR